MFCQVAPLSGSFDDRGLTYFIPPHLENTVEIGNIAQIPIKEEIKLGVVLDFIEDNVTHFDINKIKSLIDCIYPEIKLLNYQTELIKWISSHYFTPIHNATGLFFPSNLKKKLETNKVKYKENKIKYTKDVYSLSEKQNKILDEIKTSEKNKILLWGVTGSGKTEIYKKIIESNLDLGKQTLILIPEIVVGQELGERYKKSFGENVIVLNSNVSEAKKTDYWFSIYKSDAKIIVGTRSALFYPYQNLETIIIDEEHDKSYNSDMAPRYNGVEVANKISDLTGAKLILGSGTPSVESIYKSQIGEYKLLYLLEKYSKK